MPENNTAETIADLAQAASGGHILTSHDGRTFLILRDDFKSQEISDAHGLKLARPHYVSQAVTLQTVDSLVDYVERFKRPETLLFADISANSITALIDFHVSARNTDDVTTQAGHVAHKASMHLPFSEEWRLWTSISGKLMPQLEFARFIEENASDVSAPPAGELLDAVRDLQMKRKVNFSKAVRTASDNENFEYSEEVNATTRKGEVEIPTKFQLALPVYFGEPTTELYAFLRWKLDDGSLALGIQLHRVEHVRQAVFKQIVLSVGERTGCPAVFGKAA